MKGPVCRPPLTINSDKDFYHSPLPLATQRQTVTIKTPYFFDNPPFSAQQFQRGRHWCLTASA
jgi:hypothetical protein